MPFLIGALFKYLWWGKVIKQQHLLRRMRIVGDLQVHSRFSRATSSSITLKNLEKYARLKGITLLGTGDFTHPEWLKELKSELTEDGSGILTSKTGFKFVLQGEISNMYTQNGKGRRIHTLLLAKSFEVVEHINAALRKKGRLDYDGRPIFGFSCIELVEMMKSIDDDIEVIPAHVWTPWFGLFGSNGGFDSVEECFQDQAKHIHALETGMSADPAMMWRVSSLNKYTLVSNSDAHSYWPWRLGRECTVFDIDWSYDGLMKAIRTRKGLVETIEVDPNYGKYHYDGHRNCTVVLSPSETKKYHSMCPKCGHPLTIGVLSRVEELADRPEGYTLKDAIPFRTLIPLSEIIAAVEGSPVASRKTWASYMGLVGKFGSEFGVMLDVEKKEIAKIVGGELADAIIRTRNQEVEIAPGYDGVYGVPKFTLKKKPLVENASQKAIEKEEKELLRRQKDLQEFFQMHQG
jgi:uncharacterized protein (TIGR00375 family)